MARHTILIIAAAAFMTGCISRRVTTAPAPLSPAVSVRQVERHVTVYDTVPVLLPQEHVTVLNVPDTVSHLETSVAESDAWLTSDGHFCHTLSNKPTIPLVLPRDTVWQTNDSIITEYRPYPVSVEVPRELTFLQKLFMFCGLAFMIILVCRIYAFIRFKRQ